jgi:hypothetical protein
LVSLSLTEIRVIQDIVGQELLWGIKVVELEVIKHLLVLLKLPCFEAELPESVPDPKSSLNSDCGIYLSFDLGLEKLVSDINFFLEPFILLLDSPLLH